MQHFLYFLPLPHGQGSLRPTSLPVLALDIPVLLLNDQGLRRQITACHSLGYLTAVCKAVAKEAAVQRPYPGGRYPV